MRFVQSSAKFGNGSCCVPSQETISQYDISNIWQEQILLLTFERYLSAMLEICCLPCLKLGLLFAMAISYVIPSFLDGERARVTIGGSYESSHGRVISSVLKVAAGQICRSQLASLSVRPFRLTSIAWRRKQSLATSKVMA